MEVALEPSSGLRPLVDAAVGGDREAFRALVEPSIPRALGAAVILTRSESDAADAVQDALLSAWLGIASLRDADAFPAWFRRHVVRAAMRIADKRGRVTELDMDLPDAADALDRAVAQRTLARAFDRLGRDDRLLLTLRHYLGLPVGETAELLAIPEGTVKSRAHAALERLRAAYDAEERR
jgi:RNA polymerase sigma-70 factor (ECF subfamily)